MRVGVGAVMVCLLELGVVMGDEWIIGIVMVWVCSPMANNLQGKGGDK